VVKKRKLKGPTFAESKNVIVVAMIMLLLVLCFTFYMAFCFEYPSGVLATPPLGHAAPSQNLQKDRTEKGSSSRQAD
jgi:hypothetical protein